ncbi:class I tRNA ligase family protein, partial [Patescibacteria group bacterium]|nr:class I tRNA ligase family protein [Patescibacteria group bacterium]
YIAKFGADSVRLYLMFLGDVRVGGDWRDSGIAGMSRFINRVWNLYQKMELMDCGGECKDVPEGMPQMLHKTIKKVTEDIEALRFNTAISQLMIFINFVMRFNKMSRGAAETFLILLAPFAPFMAEELWSGLGHEKSIFTAEWPKYNAAMVKDEAIQMPVQINGRVRAVLTVSADISEDEARNIVMSDVTILKWLDGQEPKKVIFVKGRLVNIVV